MRKSVIVGLCIFGFLGACSSGPPQLPYPAFIQVDELDDIFMASLPGIRAKQLAGDPQTRRTSNRIDLPPDWAGTSGGSPGRSLEIFVLDGSMTIADVELPPGGYAFLPAGSLGFNLKSEFGAQILYFINDVDPEAVIRSPIIIDTGLLSWDATATAGVTRKELRRDPGTGATTWLERTEPGAALPWATSTVVREGYLVSGAYEDSECVLGETHTWSYAPGGYFYRPADAASGGPAAGATATSVWFLRETHGGEHGTAAGCLPPS